MAAPTIVQSKIANGTGGTLNVSFDSLPTIGNRVVACVVGADPVSVSDNQGHGTYTADSPGDESNFYTQIASVVVTTSSGTFTVTLTSTYGGAICVAEIADDEGLDVQYAELTPAGTDPNVGPSSSTTVANDLVIAMWGANAGSSTTTGGYTELQEYDGTSSGLSLSVAYLVVAATGAQECTWTGSGVPSSAWDANLAAYKGVDSPPASLSSWPRVRMSR